MTKLQNIATPSAHHIQVWIIALELVLEDQDGNNGHEQEKNDP